MLRGALPCARLALQDVHMQWSKAETLVEYPDALALMADRVAAIQSKQADEWGWMVEHPPLYTAGTSAKQSDLLSAKFPVFETGRGGQYTYHGPGQRVVYLMLDLKARAEAQGQAPDLRLYVKLLEGWIIATLAQLGVEGFLREGRIGVWVSTPRGECKIAALGVRVQKWVTSHGIALNVNPELAHFSGIVPCGLPQFGVTSLHALGVMVSMDEVDAVLRDEFAKVFGDSRVE